MQAFQDSLGILFEEPARTFQCGAEIPVAVPAPVAATTAGDQMDGGDAMSPLAQAALSPPIAPAPTPTTVTYMGCVQQYSIKDRKRLQAKRLNLP